MRYGIFSDVHSNQEAFESVVAAYKREGIDRYFCVGDIVGYSANPAECIQLVKELNCISVAGNHDVAAYDLEITRNFTDNARIAAEWTNYKLDNVNKNYLKSLNLTYEEDNFILVHASLDKPEDFCYIENVSDARTNFEFQAEQICFIGHSHVPGIFRKTDGNIEFLESLSISVADSSKYLVNVGSIGQPRDGDSRASFCIYDTQANVIEIKRISYDIQAAADKIFKAGLPPRLAERLFIGQ